jgi:hypothetical protein
MNQRLGSIQRQQSLGACQTAPLSEGSQYHLELFIEEILVAQDVTQSPEQQALKSYFWCSYYTTTYPLLMKIINKDYKSGT